MYISYIQNRLVKNMHILYSQICKHNVTIKLNKYITTNELYGRFDNPTKSKCLNRGTNQYTFPAIFEVFMTCVFFCGKRWCNHHIYIFFFDRFYFRDVIRFYAQSSRRIMFHRAINVSVLHIGISYRGEKCTINSYVFWIFRIHRFTPKI